MKIRLVLVALFFTSLIQAQFDSERLFPDLEGDDLRQAVIDQYKPIIILPYGPARDSMYANIYKENDTIYGVYSRHGVYIDPALDPTDAIFMNGVDNGINTEHTYPRSKGAENGNPRSDMHHLFPTRVRVNADRANLPFGEIQDNTTVAWYREDDKINTIPTTDIDEYSEWDGAFFEPREDHKGNVARAMMYFYTMYQTQADAADPSYFSAQLNTFCDWHDLDPVDSLEWIRTMQIAEYQEGKPNPFVIDCSLAGRIFCGDVSTECRTVSVPLSNEGQISELNIFPNPTEREVNISLKLNKPGNITIDLYSLLGEKLVQIFKSETPRSQYQGFFTLDQKVIASRGIYVIRFSITNQQGTTTLSRNLIFK